MMSTASPIPLAHLSEPHALPEKVGDLALRVRADQIRSVYVQWPLITIGSLIAGVALTGMMWGRVDHVLLLVWLTALCAYLAVRVWQSVRYVRARPSPAQSPYWGRIYTLTVGSAGCVWGAAGVIMFVPDSVPHQALLSLILFGIAGTGAIALSAYRPSLYALIPATLIPFILRALSIGQAESIYLALPGVIFLFSALTFGVRMNRAISHSIEKQYENLDLVEQLSQQKAVAEAARSQAEAANRAKTQFFAAASHDLRQPLHAMGLFASSLADKVKDPDALNIVHSINASVGALEGLFNELLDISKIDAGVIKPCLEHFPVARILERLRMDFEHTAREKGLRLVVRDCGLHLHSDPILLERILRNLVTNAIRYTLAGGVLVACRRHGEQLSLEVWDTGIGIPEEERDRIFEEFYQLANPERSSKKGLGLGLSIVKRLCRLLGYDIALASRVNRGSVFRFRVPIGVAPTKPAQSTPTVARGPGSLDGALIVVVDDEDAIVAGMKVLLTGWGAEVIACSSGEEAMAQVEQAQRVPDLLVVDFRLQNYVTGIDVVAHLRERFGPDIPGILVTGSTAPEHIEEAKANDLHLLLKPVMPAKLRTLINFKLQNRLGAR